MSRRRALVSACLLGRPCTYKGGHNRDAVLEQQLKEDGVEAVPFCPEEEGGMPTPRPAANLTASAADVLDGRAKVVDIDGNDVTTEFLEGAGKALSRCKASGITEAYLKERSPSCGADFTHVDGKLVEGPGVAAALLKRNGIEVFGVEGRRSSSVGFHEPS